MECLSWQEFLEALLKKEQKKMTQFKDLPTDRKRVEFCLADENINNSLQKWLEKNIPQEKQKLSGKYMELKTKGNKAYIGKDNNKALELYNQAMIHACQGEEFALVLGNRSAVLFSQKRFEECITDIDIALLNNFPTDKLWKLYKRKAEALIKLKRCLQGKIFVDKALEELHRLGNKDDEVTKLTEILISLDVEKDESSNSTTSGKLVRPVGEFNPTMKYASSHLKRCFDKTKGRYIISDQDILKGSIILSETPYAAVLLKPMFKTHCQHCFTKISLPFPCYKCIEVRYCSETCRKASWEEYHYFECCRINLLDKVGISRLAMRIILITPMQTLRLFEQQDSSKLTVSSGCSNEGCYDSKEYTSVYHLVSNSQYMIAEDLFQYSCAALLMLKVLSRFSYIDDSADSTFIGGLILRHILQLVCNAHAITSLSYTDSQSNVVEQDQVRIATAIYPTTSLLNHSCEPSIVNSFQNERLIVKLTRDVKKGEEIFNCYGPHYRRMEFKERQKILQEQYFFTCSCTHCEQGLTSVNELDCFICEKCQGILNDQGCCQSCRITDKDRLVYCENMEQTCHDNFLNALSLMTNKRDDQLNIKAAIKILKRCQKSRLAVLSPNHKKLGETNDALGKCYATLDNYESSVDYVTKSVAVTELHFGGESIEVTNELLKLSDVYMAWIQQLIDQKNKTKLNKHLTSQGIPMIERTLRLVQMNKEEGNEDIALLSDRLQSLIKLQHLL
ncbi:SET and MYND domain-containing protein 4-like [Clytia hemisphaerica]|uniref:SET and MYND domain-containing protein 4-like n=1 Tax=Clytia hemisphaerica TaxID=252671 RepID=UPI0034D47FB9